MGKGFVLMNHLKYKLIALVLGLMFLWTLLQLYARPVTPEEIESLKREHHAADHDDGTQKIDPSKESPSSYNQNEELGAENEPRDRSSAGSDEAVLSEENLAPVAIDEVDHGGKRHLENAAEKEE